MLDVSLNLVAIAAMLFGIVVPGLHIEVDSLNSPTAMPIPSGWHEVGTGDANFKASRDARDRDYSRISSDRNAMAKAREARGEVFPKVRLLWPAFSRRSFMMRARLLPDGSP
jgi:hypothetical protein